MREYETQCTRSSSMQMLMNMRPSAAYKDSSKKTNAYILKVITSFQLYATCCTRKISYYSWWSRQSALHLPFWLDQTYKQKVHFSAKDVLDYVVKYFGLKSVDLEE